MPTAWLRCVPHSPSSSPPLRPSRRACRTSLASPPSSRPSAYVPPFSSPSSSPDIFQLARPACPSPRAPSHRSNTKNQHYELIPQPTLAAAEASLRDEIGPFVEALLDRADKHLDRQARRIETLKARSDLNAGRLSHYPAEGEDGAGRRARGERNNSNNNNKQHRGRLQKLRPLDGEAALRAKVVRQRKEALKYSVERLELEVLQKERELRMRLDQA